VTRGEDTRARILHGAEEVVLRDGVAHLTLEAAASEAGISKGGILYHFPTRAALVTAMVERLGSQFDEDLEREDAGSGLPGAFTRAYLEASFGPSDDAPGSRERRLGAAVIAGVAADTELLEPLRERFAAWQRALVADGISPASASLIRLAADGLWFSELLNLAPLDEGLRSSVHEELVAHLGSSLEPRAARASSRARKRPGTVPPARGRSS
jgi:AcrR family transcriptional regulator